MAASHVLDGNAIVPPMKLSHFVLRTSRYQALLAWYKLALSAHSVFESEAVAFLTYDEEHHRLAIANIPGLADQTGAAAGVQHIAFAHANLHDLFENYERLRINGIEPVWSVNHGPTTSLYYADPDGNQIEFQVDNYDTVEEATEFFFTDVFTTNPMGVDFDPREMRRRLLAGEDETVLK